MASADTLQRYINEVNSLRCDILSSLDKLDLEELQQQVYQYNNKLTGMFRELPAESLSSQEMTSLKSLLSNHKQLIAGIEDKRNNAREELTRMKLGNAMRHTYADK